MMIRLNAFLTEWESSSFVQRPHDDEQAKSPRKLLVGIGEVVQVAYTIKHLPIYPPNQ